MAVTIGLIRSCTQRLIYIPRLEVNNKLHMVYVNCWNVIVQVEVADSSIKVISLKLMRHGLGQECSIIERWINLLAASVMIVWLKQLVKNYGIQIDVNSSSHCTNLKKLHFSHVSLFSDYPCLIALFMPLLLTHIAITHGTSWLHNLVSVSTGYTLLSA